MEMTTVTNNEQTNLKKKARKWFKNTRAKKNNIFSSESLNQQLLLIERKIY